MNRNTLEIKNLKVVFPTEMGLLPAVEGVDLSIGAGKCVAMVGESGCGKSVTSLAAMGLLPSSKALVRVDKLELDGENLTGLREKEWQKIRGKRMSMIFQDALSALNPVMTVGKQLDEIFRRHLKLSKKEAKARSIEALAMVGVPEPELRYGAFPHELSGGMRQRVLIAMAFACHPDLIIADEPTTALDVTIQAQVLQVLSQMQKKHGTSLLLITHDLSVVFHMADEIYVMYSGKIVEQAKTKDLFANPLHPYTKGLMAAVAKMGDEKGEFVQIPDSLPNPIHKPKGCYFHPRCPYATELCRREMPTLRTLENGRKIRCFHAKNEKKEKNQCGEIYGAPVEASWSSKKEEQKDGGK